MEIEWVRVLADLAISAERIIADDEPDVASDCP
jgi:hypothetical protein